jgi:hypothetical protein
MKGSSKDRSVLTKADIEMVLDGRRDVIVEKYRKKVLKDNDFKDLGFSLKLTKKDALTFQNNIANDAEFLKGYNLTDYSILLTIHKFNADDAEKSLNNYRVLRSSNGEYLYNISVIDYLCVNFLLNFRNMDIRKELKSMLRSFTILMGIYPSRMP